MGCYRYSFAAEARLVIYIFYQRVLYLTISLTTVRELAFHSRITPNTPTTVNIYRYKNTRKETNTCHG